MNQREISCIMMRGGTSKGAYFKAVDLPHDHDEIARILIAAVGAGHPLNIDGIGGGNAVTTKVAILSKSDDQRADIDYLFAQVSVEDELVDFRPTCGNILAGVGPAALEMGLVRFGGDISTVKIRSVNTGALVDAKVETPNGSVNYDGAAEINGVPGTAAPIILNFKDVIGSKTGKLFPTGSPINIIGGVNVTCIDVAMPMVIGRAEDFGITGYESRQELDGNRALFEKIEPIRIEAGELMGLGDVTKSVVPKFALLAKPRNDGAISARYFMPWNAHPAYAVTGSICTGSCLLAPGTIADGLAKVGNETPTPIKIEHPSGAIDVVFDFELGMKGFDLKSAGLIRTARKLFSGQVCIPAKCWPKD